MSKILYVNNINDIIKKYNLKKQEKDCFNHKLDYEMYTREETNNNIKKIITLENEMSNDLDNGKIFFLTQETFDYNKIITNKNGFERPYMRTTITQIELI